MSSLTLARCAQRVYLPARARQLSTSASSWAEGTKAASGKDSSSSSPVDRSTAAPPSDDSRKLLVPKPWDIKRREWNPSQPNRPRKPDGRSHTQQRPNGTSAGGSMLRKIGLYGGDRKTDQTKVTRSPRQKPPRVQNTIPLADLATQLSSSSSSTPAAGSGESMDTVDASVFFEAPELPPPRSNLPPGASGRSHSGYGAWTSTSPQMRGARHQGSRPRSEGEWAPRMPQRALQEYGDSPVDMVDDDGQLVGLENQEGSRQIAGAREQRINPFENEEDDEEDDDEWEDVDAFGPQYPEMPLARSWESVFGERSLLRPVVQTRDNLTRWEYGRGLSTKNARRESTLMTAGKYDAFTPPQNPATINRTRNPLEYNRVLTDWATRTSSSYSLHRVDEAKEFTDRFLAAKSSS